MHLARGCSAVKVLSLLCLSKVSISRYEIGILFLPQTSLIIYFILKMCIDDVLLLAE